MLVNSAEGFTGHNIYELSAPETAWVTAEAPRLQDMDQLLATVTRGPLSGVLASLPTGTRLLDIGAGAGTTVEELCGEYGADYFALDVNSELLAGRSTPLSHKLLGKSEALPVADGAFDVTFTRAVTAWNTEPEKVIAEQLRATKLGGMAVFMEFDWAPAHMDDDPNLKGWAAGTLAKEAMMHALSGIGFKPTYGQKLESDIDAVIREQQLVCSRQGGTVILPPGDHRGVLLGAADQLAAQLMKTPKGVGLGLELASAAQELRSYPPDSVKVHLPAIAIQLVQKLG